MSGSGVSPAAGPSSEGRSFANARLRLADLAFAALLTLVPVIATAAGGATFCASAYVVANEPSIDAENDVTLAVMLVVSLAAAVGTGFASFALWFVALEVWYDFSHRSAAKHSGDVTA